MWRSVTPLLAERALLLMSVVLLSYAGVLWMDVETHSTSESLSASQDTNANAVRRELFSSRGGVRTAGANGDLQADTDVYLGSDAGYGEDGSENTELHRLRHNARDEPVATPAASGDRDDVGHLRVETSSLAKRARQQADTAATDGECVPVDRYVFVKT